MAVKKMATLARDESLATGSEVRQHFLFAWWIEHLVRTNGLPVQRMTMNGNSELQFVVIHRGKRKPIDLSPEIRDTGPQVRPKAALTRDSTCRAGPLPGPTRPQRFSSTKRGRRTVPQVIVLRGRID